MYCPACGHDNLPEAVFCGKCGAALLVPPVPVPAEVATVPPAPAPAVRYSGFWRRLAGSSVDGLILGTAFGLGLFFPVLKPLFAEMRPWDGRDDFNTILAVLVTLLMIITSFVYRWLFVSLNKGQTPGKKVMQIRVIDSAGKVPSLGRAALREGTKGVLGGVPYAGVIVYLWILWDKRKQGLYDKIAGTYVVRSGE